MSATRDKSQKITFVYSNLYSLYRKGVERAREGASPEELAQQAGPRSFESGVVIKANDHARTPRVSIYTPAELLGKRVARPVALGPQGVAVSQGSAAAPQSASGSNPVAGLKQSLESLNDLQARLRFMLKELEELIKE